MDELLNLFILNKYLYFIKFHLRKYNLLFSCPISPEGIGHPTFVLQERFIDWVRQILRASQPLCHRPS
jgi:hypothetical protein